MSALICSASVELLQWSWLFCGVVLVKVLYVYVWLTNVWSIAIVTYVKVRWTTKTWTKTCMIINGIGCLIRFELVLIRYRKNERLRCWEVYWALSGHPNQRVVTTNFLSEFSYTNSQSVGNIITHRMKHISPEIIIACSVKHLH